MPSPLIVEILGCTNTVALDIVMISLAICHHHQLNHVVDGQVTSLIACIILPIGAAFCNPDMRL